MTCKAPQKMRKNKTQKTAQGVMHLAQKFSITSQLTGDGNRSHLFQLLLLISAWIFRQLKLKMVKTTCSLSYIPHFSEQCHHSLRLRRSPQKIQSYLWWSLSNFSCTSNPKSYIAYLLSISNPAAYLKPPDSVQDTITLCGLFKKSYYPRSAYFQDVSLMLLLAGHLSSLSAGPLHWAARMSS